jgi:hypothetical protein
MLSGFVHPVKAVKLEADAPWVRVVVGFENPGRSGVDIAAWIKTPDSNSSSFNSRCDIAIFH